MIADAARKAEAIVPMGPGNPKPEPGDWITEGVAVQVAFRQIRGEFCEQERVCVNLKRLAELIGTERFVSWRETLFLTALQEVRSWGGKIEPKDEKPDWIDLDKETPMNRFSFHVSWKPGQFYYNREGRSHAFDILKTMHDVCMDMRDANSDVVPISRSDS